MPVQMTSWRERLREAIRRKVSAQRLVPADQVDAEADRRFERLMQMEVPSDAELRTMQARGELPPDDVLARAYP
jgi:hypothetical protein